MLKAQFQELILGDGGLTQFIKILLDLGTNILKFANSDVGQLIIKTTLLVGTFSLLKSGVSLVTKTIGNSIKEFIAYQTALATMNGITVTSLKALTVGLLASAQAWAISPFGMVTIAVGGILLIAEGFKKLTGYLQEQSEALSKTTEEYENTKKEIESTQSELDSVNEKIKKINAENGIKTTRDGELEKLQAEREELELKVALLKEEQATKAQDLYSEAKDSLEKRTASKYNNLETGYTEFGQKYEIPDYVYQYQELDTAVEKMKQYEQEIDNLRSKMDTLREANQNGSDEYKNLSEQLNTAKNNLNDTRKYASKLADSMEDQVKGIDAVDDGYDDLSDSQKKLYNNTKKSLNGWKNYADKMKDVEDESDKASNSMYDLGVYSSESMNSMNDATSDSQQIISDLASEIDNITNAYQTAVDAQYEYNQQGYLSVDTYSQLMQLAPQYLAMMIDENGQLYANANATNVAYQAKVYEMGITAARAQIQLADSLANEAGAYASLGSAASSSVPSVYSLLEAELKLKKATMDDADYNALVKNINAISLMTKQTMDNVKYTTNSIKPTQASTNATKGNTGANKGNTGARKANTDAIKNQTNALKKQKEALEEEADALEKQIDDYEIVIDYVKDLLKEEQEAVEEQKDKQLEAIQDKIDALEKEQEAFEENIDKQVEALEKQRDETESYWDEQIDAIQNANDALEENMELQKLQEALATAKSQKIKVFKNGRFVYAEDDEEITKAEQDLADYEQQLAVQRQIEELERLKEEALNSLDKQIEELENYRDRQKENYDKQLKDLQDHYDKVEEEYDKRIKQYDEWLEEFEDMLEASSKRHAKILYNELVNEKGNWDDRIDALSNFVKKYESKKNQLDKIKTQIEAIDKKIKSIQSKAKTSYNTTKNYANLAKGYANDAVSYASKANKAVSQAKSAEARADQIRRNVIKSIQDGTFYKKLYNDVKKSDPDSPLLPILKTATFATGTYEVQDNQIALVADPMRPSNRELIVGSKINKGAGVLTSLKKGTGVVPSGRNLTENLVKLAQWSQSGGIERTFSYITKSFSRNVNIENLNLPYVKNGEDFIEYLQKNFFNDAIQFGNIR